MKEQKNTVKKLMEHGKLFSLKVAVIFRVLLELMICINIAKSGKHLNVHQELSK